MSTQSKPSRDEARFIAGLRAIVRYDDGEYPCTALDLNRHGVMLAGELPAPSDPDVAVTLSSAAGDLSLHVKAHIVHFHEVAGEARLGLQFEPLMEAEQKILDALLARVLEGLRSAPLDDLARDASPQEVRTALSRISVGQRVQMARRADPRERSFLRQDTDLLVLEGLARNPKLTVPEVIAMLRQVQMLPTTLDLFARDPRWCANEEIKVLVATHSRVTLAAAERALEGLSENALLRVLRRPGLKAVLRQKLLTRIPRKKLQGWA